MQKNAYNKEVIIETHIFNKKIWLKSKYIKIKKNYMLKNKFFGFFLYITYNEKASLQIKAL